jgi:hypothetical protein
VSTKFMLTTPRRDSSKALDKRHGYLSRWAMRSRTSRTFAIGAIIAGLLPAALFAQQSIPDSRLPTATERAGLSGPRVGATFLTTSMRDKLLADHNIKVGPVISQFGWQFERQFLGNEGGPTAVSEWVVMVGGLDQGVFLPSLTWLVGIRTSSGQEIGVGPNVTPAGVALAIAAGVTKRAGSMNIPFNLAVVPSQNGVRMSLLTGFTMR